MRPWQRSRRGGQAAVALLLSACLPAPEPARPGPGPVLRAPAPGLGLRGHPPAAPAGLRIEQVPAGDGTARPRPDAAVPAGEGIALAPARAAPAPATSAACEGAGASTECLLHRTPATDWRRSLAVEADPFGHEMLVPGVTLNAPRR